MVYLFSRTNIPKNKTIKHNSGVVTGLEPCDLPKYSLECPHILTLANCVHYHHYPSLQIVIEKRLHFTKHLLQAGCSSLLSIHVILLPIEAGDSLCVPQSTSYSFASTISTYCSAWAWDHDCHITVYDLSR